MKFKFIYLLSLIVLSFLSCNSSDDERVTNDFVIEQPEESPQPEEEEQTEAQCDSSNSNFNQLYSSLANSSNFDDVISMDTDYHTYSFEVLNNKTICKIGYQSLVTFNTTPYLIEIFDNTNNTIIYSGSHLFSFTSTSYVDIDPIQVQTNHSYTIKRIQTNWNGKISNTIGRLLQGEINFPIVNGDLVITGSSFYRNESDDAIAIPHMPYIDIVFQN